MAQNELRFLVRRLTINEGSGVESHSLCYISALTEHSFASTTELIRKAQTSEVVLKDLKLSNFDKERSNAEYLSELRLERRGKLWIITAVKL